MFNKRTGQLTCPLFVKKGICYFKNALKLQNVKRINGAILEKKRHAEKFN